MPFKSLLWIDALFGLDTIDQVVPFHCSTSVWSGVASWAIPTAMQKSDEVQETPVNALSEATVGTAAKDHVAPFQCSTRGLLNAVPSGSDPTAVQSSVATQDTPASPPP